MYRKINQINIQERVPRDPGYALPFSDIQKGPLINAAGARENIDKDQVKGKQNIHDLFFLKRGCLRERPIFQRVCPR